MTDYLGPERGEQENAALAESWRIAFGVDGQACPDVLWCVETRLPELFPQFALLPRLDSDLPDDFAVAKYDPPRIELRDSVYWAVKSRHPRARFIVIHELAHIVTHHQALPKHLKDTAHERKLIQKMSTEHQADEFTQHFLVPQHIIARMTSIGAIMRQCGVTYSLAVEAGLSCGIRPRRKLLPYEKIDLDREEEEDFSEFVAGHRRIPGSL